MKTDAKTSRQTPWALPRQYAECSRAAAGSAAGFISPETCCSGRVPKAHQGMVTAALRSVFSLEEVTVLVERWDDLASSLT